MYYQNTRGLRTKTHNFYRQISLQNYDIVVLTETWLNDSVLSSELFDKRYIVYRRDRDHGRKKDGGGVLIAVSKKINSKRMAHWESRCEDLWITVELAISKSVRQLTLCAVYLPPPVLRAPLEYFLDGCCNVFEQSNSFTFILGDFNLGNVNWSLVSDPTNGYKAPGISQILTDFTYANGLVQINNIGNSSGRILDLVLTNLPSACVYNAQNALSNIDSLHPPLEIIFKASLDLRLPYNRNNVRLIFFKADYDRISKAINEIDWHSILNDISDVNDMLGIFYVRINNIIKSNVPVKGTTKLKYPPWFDRSLIRSLKEKEKSRKRYKVYNNPRDKVEFQLLSKRCSHLAITCYNKYIENIESDIVKNPKQFWTYIKNKRGGSSTFPISMTNGSVTTSDGQDICEMFAAQYSSVYNVAKPNQDPPLPDYFHVMRNNSLPLTTPVLLNDDIINKFKCLDHGKGAGPDGIPPVFISKCASALATPLSLIYNKSLATGVFPDTWKMAKVVPIYKCGNRDNVANYRPISILSTFAKVLEALICPFLRSHLRLYLSGSQHGFVASRSTGTNLLTFSETLTEAIDAGKQLDVIYSDFSKAFDRVSHKILFNKLEVYGVTGDFLNWFRSYLENRSFFVAINGYSSCTYNTASGVPQGSHIGPVLFNVFVNDIPQCFYNSECFMYADDLKFCRVIESEEDVVLLQQDLNNLVEWCCHNDMVLNIAKCYHIKFSRNRKLIPSQYRVGSDVIQEVDQVKDLGVQFDRNLTFIPHIESIIKRASKMLSFVLRNVVGFRHNKTKILVYNCLVRTILEYCSTIWRPHYATHMLRLERIQKRFLWHLSYSSGIAKSIRSYSSRLDHFKMLSLDNRYKLIDSLFVVKILQGKIDCPKLLSMIRLRVPARYPRAPITSLYPPLRRTVLGANSAIPRICKLLNGCGDLFDIHVDSLAKLRKIMLSCKDKTV